MVKKLFVFLLAVIISGSGFGAQNAMAPNRFINKSLYKNIYPSTLNNTRLNNNNNDVSSIKLNSNMANNTSMKTVGKRNVVKRKTRARAATTTAPVANQRRVVARSGTVNTNYIPGRTNRQNIVRNTAPRGTTNLNGRFTSNQRSTVSTNNNTNTKVSASRCFADYKECMDAYCEREDTAYNRCYCSAKLAQIDAKYQNNIDRLLQEIVRLKSGSTMTSEEIKDYWEKTMSVYTHDNLWVDIENALNINWADTESRVRGQNAFNTGHQYCVSHLNACYYMATNLRDAYKSEIARDCATYESNLQKVQTAAESVIENYND